LVWRNTFVDGRPGFDPLADPILVPGARHLLPHTPLGFVDLDGDCRADLLVGVDNQGARELHVYLNQNNAQYVNCPVLFVGLHRSLSWAFMMGIYDGFLLHLVFAGIQVAEKFDTALRGQLWHARLCRY
jgi:hypothetical protein